MLILIPLCFFESLTPTVNGQVLNTLGDSVFACELSTMNGFNFEPLASHIKDKRIIILSEHRHYDGAALELQNDLIRYLHENHNFNILLIESGFFPIEFYWDNLKQLPQNNPINYAVVSRFYGILNSQINRYNLILSQCNSGVPIRLGGIDLFFDRISIDSVYQNLLLFTHKFNLDQYASTINELRTRLKSINKNPSGEIEIVAFEESIYRIYKLLAEILVEKELLDLNETETNEFEFWIQTLRVLGAYYEYYTINDDNQKKKNLKNLFQTGIRDSIMFSNLMYYNARYSDEKIIIICSSRHSIRNINMISDKIDNSYSFGHLAYEHFDTSIYSIAMISYGGFYGTQFWKDRVNNKSKNSIEFNLHNNNYNYAFLDLNQFNGMDERYKLTFSLEKEIESQWSNHFDGILFIDKMEIDSVDINYYRNNFLEFNF